MRVLFFRMASYFSEKNPHPENVLMPIEIAIMATIAENHGHEVFLLDTEAVHCSMEDLVFRIKEISPDIIVLKAKSPSNKDILDLFLHTDLKHSSFQIIGIGHTFSTDPEFFHQNGLPLYCSILGEPESSFDEILKNWGPGQDKKNIRGIKYYENGTVVATAEMPLLDDLDLLPRPKYDWFFSENYYSQFPIPLFVKRRMAFMLATRGCPMKCIFCSPNLRQSTGSKYRTHSVERIVQDLSYLEGQGIPIVSFRDDIFTLDKNFIQQLCHKIIDSKLKIKWMAQTHINHVDEELLTLMKRANCITLAFGLESGSPEVLKKVRKTNDIPHAIKMFKVMHRLGIKTVGYFIVGNPGETLADIELTKKFIKQINPHLIQVALFTPYKGSEAFKLLDERMMVGKGEIHHYNKVGYNFSKIDPGYLEKMPQEFYMSYILRPKNFLRFSLQTVVDLFFNTRLILKLIMSAFRFLVLRPLKFHS